MSIKYQKGGMTELGQYLSKKSASKAEIAKKTGISKSRSSELTLNPSTQLRARELYLIAMAIDVAPGEMFEEIFKGLKLENDWWLLINIKYLHLKEASYDSVEIVVSEREKTFWNKENLEIGLKIAFKELFNYKLFLKGFNIKCINCSSHFWYPLTEMDHTVNCKWEYQPEIETLRLHIPDYSHFKWS